MDQWVTVLFTRFSLNTDSRSTFLEKIGDRYLPSNTCEIDNYGGRDLMVWAVIMLYGLTQLRVFERGSVTGISTSDIVSRPSCDNLRSLTSNFLNEGVFVGGWFTSGLLRHLQIQHNISKATQSVSSGSQNTEITKRKIDSDNDIRITSEQKKPLLSHIFLKKKETLDEIVSKLVCVDGFTVNAITKSNFIRKSLHDKGYSFPPNPSDVMKLVYKQYNVIKARVTNEISSKLNVGLRCSLTFDKFTSLKNRRYLNKNVHFNEGEIFNLGMLRISGYFSAENSVKAVETKLQEFGILTESCVCY
ncbi:BED-type domain-containing protein [Trichonephila clavipes]|nr:BED-type domain-containing protein [Trichonephila clavipes]